MILPETNSAPQRYHPIDSNKNVDIKFRVHDLYRVHSLFRQYNLLKLKLIKCYEYLLNICFQCIPYNIIT